MKFALVTPPYNIYRQLYGIKLNENLSIQPQVGLGYIGAMLEKAGHQTLLIDALAEGIPEGVITRRLGEFGPDLIGVNALTLWSQQAFALIRTLKRSFPVPVLLGGPHVTATNEESLLECPEIDALVYGEAEETLSEICARAEAGEDWHGVQGIIYRLPEGGIRKNLPRSLVSDLDSLPSPAWRLYDLKRYRPLPHKWRRLPTLPMVTARGCDYAQCTFCALTEQFKVKYRRHSPERVVEDIRKVQQEYGIRDIYFEDDNFVNRRKWMFEFCERMARSGMGVSWSCETKIDSVDRGILRAMADAGCWMITYGIESGSQDLLDLVEKGITIEQTREVVRWTHEVGISPAAFFILALPGETPEKGERTIRFAIELDLDHAIFNLCYPEGGVHAFLELCRKMGRIKENYDYHFKEPSFVPTGYKDEREVSRMFLRAYRRFYLRPGFFWKHLRRIRSWEDAKPYWHGLRYFLGFAG
ncbi:MAG: radical SAM protein [Nitrospirae bacterium]|nr:radical SAM protein [Nitrospirota bacterium]